MGGGGGGGRRRRRREPKEKRRRRRSRIHQTGTLTAGGKQRYGVTRCTEKKPTAAPKATTSSSFAGRKGEIVAHGRMGSR